MKVRMELQNMYLENYTEETKKTWLDEGQATSKIATEQEKRKTRTREYESMT